MLNNQIPVKYITPLRPIHTALHKSGVRLAGIRCVLFDIYGTLFISASGDIGVAHNPIQHLKKIDQLVEKFGVNMDSMALMNALNQAIETTHRKQKENGVDCPEIEIDHIWRKVLQSIDTERIREFALEYEMIVNPVYPMPHLKEMVKTCREKKVLMGLISNAQFYTPYLFKWFLGAEPERLGFHPDLIFLSYQFGCAKPSAQLFQAAAKILRKLNIPMHATLFTGNDMLNDIYPAKQTGFKTALFAGDKRSLRLRQGDPRCRNLSADLVITDLMQLFDYID